MSHATIYEQFEDNVRRLAKPGWEIAAWLTAHPDAAHLWHMASCAQGEAGELFDEIKQYAIYGNQLDLAKIEKELGDIEFYLEGIRGALIMTREQTLAANVKKLNARYPQGHFSNAAALARADGELKGPQPTLADSEDTPD